MIVSSSPRILLVDDDEGLLDLIAAVLGPLGFELRPTTSATDALQLLAHERFDLVISDLVMPGVDGNDLIDVMRARGDDTPVLFLSGSGAVPVVVKLMRSGASGFLEKPFAAAELKQEVLSLLAADRQRRANVEISATRLAGAPISGYVTAPPPALPGDDRVTEPPPRPLPRPSVTAIAGQPRASKPPSSRHTEVPSEPTPKHLGRYTLLEELASGGMGKVYRAHDPTLDRAVAIKVVVPPTSRTEREEFETRFRREAIALAKLRHPHIVAVHDCGTDDVTGGSFLVMELIEGRSLGDLIDEGERLPLPRALRFVVQLADALAVAHRHGIVHRDVKPDNVIVDADDDVHLIDFGVARTNESDVTSARFVVGTPSYLSPEAATGAPIDWRADQFSLATLILELLSGTSVFRSDGVPRTMRNVKEAAVPTLRELGRDDVPEALQLIVARMHAKQPDDRFQDEAELTTALREVYATVTAPAA
jgi:CheY-like chemotaxis protein/predicted Ser/Thr protein kinase